MRHSFSRYFPSRSRLCHSSILNIHNMSIQMRDFFLVSNQSFLQTKSNFRIQIISSSLKPWMIFDFNKENKVSWKPIRALLAFTLKNNLATIIHPLFYLNFHCSHIINNFFTSTMWTSSLS